MCRVAQLQQPQVFVLISAQNLGYDIFVFLAIGVVFPYYSDKGRYRLNFLGAQRACQDQDATLATFEQLFTAWDEGLDWCNAGWLADGTVQYPITAPRDGCGGSDLAPGLRSYGQRHRLLHRFDAFCFSAAIKGQYYLPDDFDT